jgi:hypothetical protein
MIGQPSGHHAPSVHHMPCTLVDPSADDKNVVKQWVTPTSASWPVAPDTCRSQASHADLMRMVTRLSIKHEASTPLRLTLEVPKGTDPKLHIRVLKSIPSSRSSGGESMQIARDEVGDEEEGAAKWVCSL